jgi:DNA-directed RNA polymerase subunit RPC12/RpoP
VTARDPYTRCPDCGFVAPPESMDYVLAGRESGDIDWGQPVHVRCMICGAAHDIGAGAVLRADAEMACRHCGTTVPHPAGAARVQCPGCGVFLLGPDLSTAQQDELRIAEGLRGLALRERVRVAKERAALRARGTAGP